MKPIAWTREEDLVVAAFEDCVGNQVSVSGSEASKSLPGPFVRFRVSDRHGMSLNQDLAREVAEVLASFASSGKLESPGERTARDVFRRMREAAMVGISATFKPEELLALVASVEGLGKALGEPPSCFAVE